MVSKGRNYNELGNSEIAVCCKLDPGISPAKWAYLCRYIGNLSPQEFSQVSSLLNPHHRSLKMALMRHIRGLIELGDAQSHGEVPLVSVGCSGIGGDYQREIGGGSVGR